MAIVYDMGTLDRYMTNAVDASPEHPVLIDKFVEDAFELDVDAVADETGAVVIGGIMEHIEEAGIHSGDSSCVVPPYLVAERHLATIRDYTRRIARALKVVGLMNVAVRHQRRCGVRARGEPARVAHGAVSVEGDRRAAGENGGARDGGQDAVAARPRRGSRSVRRVREDAGVSVRALPGRRHDSRTRDEVDRRSDGRLDDVRRGVREGACSRPASGCRRRARRSSASTTTTSRTCCRSPATSRISDFRIVATRGTAAYLRAHGIPVEVVFKVNEGRPNIVDHILNNQVQIIVNTPLGRESFFDDRAMRRVAMLHNVPCITTLTGASAAVEAIRAVRTHALDVRAIQDYHAEIAARAE